MDADTLLKHRADKAKHARFNPAAKKKAEEDAGTDHHAALGVHSGATPSEIRGAFLRLTQLHHPDKGG